MKAEEDTREISNAEPGHSQDDLPTPDLGSWGMDAVPLSREQHERKPAESPRHAETKPHHLVALAAIVCVVGLLAALGANAIGGKPGPRAERPHAAQTRQQPLVDAPEANGARAAHQVKERHGQARSKSGQRSIQSTRPTHPAPSPPYAPAPDPAPAPEPVAPSPAPAPVPGPSPTTKPQLASGPTVANEFGFER